MFTILNKYLDESVNDRENVYEQNKQSRELFDSFVSCFRSEQGNNAFGLRYSNGRGEGGFDREVDTTKTSKSRHNERSYIRNSNKDSGSKLEKSKQ
jgi:hypothetical protein